MCSTPRLWQSPTFPEPARSADTNLAFARAGYDGPTCNATATDKKLAGAAKTSFLKTCGMDAAATCDTGAAEKKPAGAANSSFPKKSLKDAVG